MNRRVMILLLAVLLFNSGCGACGEDKLTESTSPGNRYVATVFRRGCGATTGFLYHVNIRNSNDSFSADLKGAIEDGQIFLTSEGKINLSWKDDNNLHVSCNGCPADRKPMRQSLWNDVTISYELR